jgi:tRNA(fMet)-specific endonuclease VapC
MQRALLDTDILSEVIKGIHPNVVANAKAYAEEHRILTFTSASTYEILGGLFRKSAKRQIERTEALFAKNEEIAPTPMDYRLAAEISGTLIQLGTPIGLIDPIIAACALRRGMAIATGNIRHFTYIQDAGFDFPIQNWRESLSIG